ncbi:MAG: hypothetical protein CMI02_14580 [Oceanospirillaceae bacterium]|nr:hypothetical protein [Oceanospirillaceae bacterium]MBT13249.1 hypothetical protein [Oceanospirillaceae bacterium]|tara:strand:+ start:405 stop:665 length:261 start_codon:yes stop_codon:yes gene_type:complete
MSKSYDKIDGVYYPKKNINRKNKLVGNRWKVWSEGGRYYIEYDAGHFSDKFVIKEINKEVYDGIYRLGDVAKLSDIVAIISFGDSE